MVWIGVNHSQSVNQHPGPLTDKQCSKYPSQCRKCQLNLCFWKIQIHVYCVLYESIQIECFHTRIHICLHNLIGLHTLNQPWVVARYFEHMHLIPLIKCCRWRVPFVLPSDDHRDAINENRKLSYILQTVLGDRYWKNHLLTFSSTDCVILNLLPYFQRNCLSAVACKHFLWLNLY